jgi:branched-chain amino acid transport system substrate-binding protein
MEAAKARSSSIIYKKENHKMVHAKKVIFGLLFFLLGIQSNFLIAGEIKLGFVSDLSGSGFLITLSQKAALEIGLEEINSSGGLLGNNVELIIRDSQQKPKLGGRLVRDLILKEKVQFFIGPPSPSVGLEISMVCSKLRKVILFPGANNESFTNKNSHRYLFQIIPNTYMEGQAVAIFLNKKKFKKIAIIGPNLEYGRSMAAALKKKLSELDSSSQVVKTIWVKLGTQNYLSHIKTLFQAEPEVIFSILWAGDLGNFIRQASPSGLFRKVAFLGLFDYDLLKGLGQEMEPNLFGFDRAPFYAIKNNQMKKFVDKYKHKTGEFPSAWAIMAYDSLTAIKKAIEKAGSLDTEEVVKALEGLQWDSLRGPLFIRPANHIANSGLYFGTTFQDPTYPFYTMKDMIYIPGQKVWHSKEDIESQR